MSLAAEVQLRYAHVGLRNQSPNSDAGPAQDGTLSIVHAACQVSKRRQLVGE